MVETMNRAEQVSGGAIPGKEDPTDVAVLFIRLVPLDAGDEQFRRPAGFRQQFKKDRAGILSARRRIHAAIEAEAAAVPEVDSEIIDKELSQIMLPRPAVNDPAVRRSSRRISWSRRSSLMEVLRGSPVRAGGQPHLYDQEPTAAAELHIMLVHG
jgi:hypothetical protein